MNASPRSDLTPSEIYKGAKRNGLYHGTGTLTLGNVTTRGEFREGRLYCGTVSTTQDSGRVCVRVYIKGRSDDKVYVYNNDNTAYVGTIRDNKPDQGTGTWFMKDGVVMVGMWENGLMTGPGCLQCLEFPDHKLVSGVFERGTLIPQTATASVRITTLMY